MTMEKLLDSLVFNIITPKQANEILKSKENQKIINSFVNRDKFTTAKLGEHEMGKLNAVVGVLQIIYNSGTEPCVSDYNYDIMEEMLINEGVPRQSGSLEINPLNKKNHKYPQLRGTLTKVHYLRDDEKRTNPSRKYIDEKIKSLEQLYFRRTGRHIDLNELKVQLGPKFDGVSCVLEKAGNEFIWLTRGDTKANEASDVSHIMKVFNDVYANYGNCGIKFEIVMSEASKDEANQLYYADDPYKNSRSIVSSILSSKEPDFRIKYLHPIPLRVLEDGEEIEEIARDLCTRYPSVICKLGDRDRIKRFADENKYVTHSGHKFRTDGVVITILDPAVQKVLGRENDINNFEIAYKFTEDKMRTFVKDIEFYTSDFGHITPVLVVTPVKLKGNTIDHISLSNKDRFDELDLHIGDEILVLYDIIPYVTMDASCKRSKGKKIEFPRRCPVCGEPLDLTATIVKCENDECESQVIGRILNYCASLRIKDIGYSTIETLWRNGLLKNGIRSLYKLKKKTLDIEELNGFGKLKTAKIIREIEARRRIKDYEFFGAYGVEGLSTKTFQMIFATISFTAFCDYLGTKKYDTLKKELIMVPDIGEKRADLLIAFFKKKNRVKELGKLIEELQIIETFNKLKPKGASRGTVVFSMFRDNDLKNYFEDLGFLVSDSWTNKANVLVVPNLNVSSTKVDKAKTLGIPIMTIEESKRIVPTLGKRE
jgi:NAD-dependent DNA ligase